MSTSDKETVPKAERLELIRRLLIAGRPDWEIRRDLTRGIALDDGRICKVSPSTASRDLDDVGLAYKALHDNPLIAERVVGAATERLTRIADKAEAVGQFNAAIRANLALVDIVGRHHPRWSRRGDTSSSSEDERPTDPYEDMSDEELRAELEAKRERVLRLVHDKDAG